MGNVRGSGEEIHKHEYMLRTLNWDGLFPYKNSENVYKKEDSLLELNRPVFRKNLF